MEIRCETAVVWLMKDEPGAESRTTRSPDRRAGESRVAGGGRVKEIYAEGIVRIRQKEEVHECESAFFDFVHERGIIVDPDSRYPITTRTARRRSFTSRRTSCGCSPKSSSS